jgi:iron complex transport system substrate-binding protein
LTVELDATPRNLVAYTGMAAALYDFGVLATGVFGPTLDGEGNPTTQAGDLPVDQLTVIGNTWGEFDVETYAALAPEVLLTHYYVDPASMWYLPEGVADEVTSLAPPVLLNADDGANTLDDVVGRHAALAEALGADLDAAAVVAARERYDAAIEALRAAAAANPVRVLACSAAAEVFYASNPGSGNDLRFFTELGVDLIVPDDLDAETGGYYESLSWRTPTSTRPTSCCWTRVRRRCSPMGSATSPPGTRCPLFRPDRSSAGTRSRCTRTTSPPPRSSGSPRPSPRQNASPDPKPPRPG